MEDGLGYPDHFSMLSYEGHRATLQISRNSGCLILTL